MSALCQRSQTVTPPATRVAERIHRGLGNHRTGISESRGITPTARNAVVDSPELSGGDYEPDMEPSPEAVEWAPATRGCLGGPPSSDALAMFANPPPRRKIHRTSCPAKIGRSKKRRRWTSRRRSDVDLLLDDVEHVLQLDRRAARAGRNNPTAARHVAMDG